MVTRSEAFPSRYWKADDLPEEGITLKVAKLEIDQIGPDREEKYVLYFKGQDKRLVLNVTNWDLIACFCGADSNSWTGKEVVLFPTTTTFGSKTMPCVRVRRPRTVAPSLFPAWTALPENRRRNAKLTNRRRSRTRVSLPK